MSLVLLWGSSFMFTSIAIRTVDPLSVVFFRILIGAIILTIYLYARSKRLPFDMTSWLIFCLLGFVGYLLPFFLIAWGQQTLDSGLAGMIMAIMPLVTMILAHYLIPNETLNRFKIFGFILGITGVTLLLGPVFRGEPHEILSAIAIFVAACSYALNAILVRRLPPFSPMVAGAGVLFAASLCLLPLWLAQQHIVLAQISSASLWSVIWLGIGPTGIATIILFAIIERAGPTFLSTINYLIPVVAFLSGVWVLSEPMNLSSLIALAIILTGIALTRFRAAQNARSLS
jgi:drug/metabolite transporter (DMT)-like permease